MFARSTHIVLLAALAVLVAGCDSWWGTSEGPPLPGKRLSVLTHASTVEPDPELAQAQILLPPPTPNAEWPQAGGYANHAMQHIEVGESLHEVWRADVGVASDSEERIVASPIAAAGKVFAMDAENHVTAFDAKTGKEQWSVDLTPKDEDPGEISGGIAFDDGKVYAATGFAEVVALDAANGKILWRKSVEAPMRAAPTVRGGRVFVITVENKVYALNAKNGDVLWFYAGAEEVASLLGAASPAVDEGIVVAPFSSGELAALTVESGRVLWTDNLTTVRRTDVVSSLAQIRGRPIIDRGRVYAISHGGLMAAIDLRSGQRIWDKEIGGIESPWIAGDYLFVLTNDWDLICVARNTGRIFWVHSLPRFTDETDRTGPIVWTGPILASDRLIVAGSQGEALAISPYDGHVLGSQELPDGVSVAPIVADGTVYVETTAAELVALR